MNKNVNIFFAAIMIAAVISEIANQYGVGICVYLPLMFGLLWLGLRAFPVLPGENLARMERLLRRRSASPRKDII